MSSPEDIGTPPGKMIGRLSAGLNSGSRRSTAALNFLPVEFVRKAKIGRALSVVGTLREITGSRSVSRRSSVARRSRHGASFGSPNLFRATRWAFVSPRLRIILRA